MRSLKPNVGQAEVAALLEEHFGKPIQRLEQVAGGQVARTFSFVAEDRAYIVRFNRRMGANFEKEVFIAGAYSSPLIPVPRIVHLGRLGELRYAISEKAIGRPLTELAAVDAAALVRVVLRTLDAIHAADVGATAGYGVFGDDGNGLFPSWRRYLEAIREEEPEWEYFGKWHALFETTFLERDVWERHYERMVRLLDSCPEDRFLVHGNFGFGNVLAHGGEVTAVLDWLDAAYGDFLFDVAWLDFWDAGGEWAEVCRDHFDRKGVQLPSLLAAVAVLPALRRAECAALLRQAGEHPRLPLDAGPAASLGRVTQQRRHIYLPVTA